MEDAQIDAAPSGAHRTILKEQGGDDRQIWPLDQGKHI
jgi:hypothetical protein